MDRTSDFRQIRAPSEPETVRLSGRNGREAARRPRRSAEELANLALFQANEGLSFGKGAHFVADGSWMVRQRIGACSAHRPHVPDLGADAGQPLIALE
jgi:hypothetical protein